MKRDIETLIANNQGIVHNVARKHFASRRPDDDLIQCGMIGLWEAAEKWGGVDPFPAFARVCVYHNMMDYVRGLTAKKRAQWEELTEADIAEEDQYTDLDTTELLTEISQVFPLESIEYAILSHIALNGEIRPVERFLSLDISEVQKIAKRAWRAIIEARRAKEYKDKE